MKSIPRLLSLAAMASVLAFTACEEDIEVTKAVEQNDSTVTVVDDSIQPPALKAVNSEIATVIKFEVKVSASQVQDTVQYLVLEADAEAPTSEVLLSHKDKSTMPMVGNYSRVTFASNLKEQTDYMVYAVIGKEQHVSEVASLAITTSADG